MQYVDCDTTMVTTWNGSIMCIEYYLYVRGRDAPGIFFIPLNVQCCNLQQKLYRKEEMALWFVYIIVEFHYITDTDCDCSNSAHSLQ